MDKITFDFSNKTAVITGGAQGFGLDIAKRFLNSGAKVIIWDIDSKMIKEAIAKASKQCQEQGIIGARRTPFMLKAINDITEGKSSAANVKLIQNNAKLAAQISVELSKLN